MNFSLFERMLVLDAFLMLSFRWLTIGNDFVCKRALSTTKEVLGTADGVNIDNLDQKDWNVILVKIGRGIV